MDITDHLGASHFATNIAVIVACLPELVALAPQFARSDLLDGFEKLCKKNPGPTAHSSRYYCYDWATPRWGTED